MSDLFGMATEVLPVIQEGAQGLMSQGGGATGSTFGNAIGSSAPNLAQRPEGNMFSPIVDDADFYTRMNAGEFDGMADNPEMNKAVMGYMMQDAPSANGEKNWTRESDHALGMSAYKDMSQVNQATPLDGLMGMATKGQQPVQPKKDIVQQGLMNPWGR